MMTTDRDVTTSGLPEEVLEGVIGIANAVAEDWEAERFLIGNTRDLEEARLALQTDRIIALYETDNPENAIALEEALVLVYRHHPKYAGDLDGHNPDASNGVTNFVYVALWYT